ncbi:MAG: arginase family protein [Candidatus Sungbacteria bacterium]|nr:arginase family protein [bacterium]MDZ4260277.1 arginase family protein [Candidatus Sungbacteria bacterium]
MIVFRVCYDKGGGNKSFGARFGPAAIERAFKRWPWRGAEDGTPHPKLSWVSPFMSLEGYRRRAESLFAKKKGREPFITLSGDNSCSFETVRAVKQHVQDTHIALAILDAHPDACAPGHDPHANWVRRLWDEGIVKPEKTAFFGIRDAERDEALYIKEKKAAVITSDKIYIAYSGGNRINTEASDFVDWEPHSAHALVIVVDIDVLDPAYAPGTGVLRAGGLHVRHVLHIIRRLCAHPFAMKVGEICEVIPEEGNRLRPASDQRPDPCGLTVLAAEAIFREMIRSMAV